MHVDGGFKHEENMRIVVSVDGFAICTKVLSAEGTAVPLSDDALHVPVTECKGMRKIPKIACYNPINTS